MSIIHSLMEEAGAIKLTTEIFPKERKAMDMKNLRRLFRNNHPSMNKHANEELGNAALLEHMHEQTRILRRSFQRKTERLERQLKEVNENFKLMKEEREKWWSYEIRKDEAWRRKALKKDPRALDDIPPFPEPLMQLQGVTSPTHPGLRRSHEELKLGLKKVCSRILVDAIGLKTWIVALSFGPFAWAHPWGRILKKMKDMGLAHGVVTWIAT
ncbi:hypothetical protein L6452_37468 [Arctium lappa]|uniref:Uncharacterized protein n=1 Tax=Arctium lappa TaxID=4217 RepID=A0ACB8Y474_ARCLA|nr:hypothetical protein L6452_37468 [Arctium lappa]